MLALVALAATAFIFLAGGLYLAISMDAPTVNASADMGRPSLS